MLKKILYADSGANNAQEMLKQLLKLPALSNSKLFILRTFSSVTEAKETADIELAESSIKDLIPQLSINPNFVEGLVREGDKKALVVDVAKEIDADIIIMGSRGLGRLQSILANSTSQYVFQLTERSLLLIKDDIYVKRIKRVMVAIDKSPAAQYALDEAMNLFQGYSDAEIYLTRVNPDLKTDLEITRADIETNSILSKAAAKVKSRGFSYRCLLVGGKPAKQICNLASDYNIDFLVLGSPERRPSVAKNLPDLERLLGSSLSDYVRIKVECPVLFVRREEA
ncbi:MAG: universal stress protein [Cyanobacteria bacterium P01_F01_bin.143]